jgi:hypothetical protein
LLPAFGLGMRTFYERFVGSAAGMRDLLDVMHDVTGYDPQGCADKWLVAAAVPEMAECP